MSRRVVVNSSTFAENRIPQSKLPVPVPKNLRSPLNDLAKDNIQQHKLDMKSNVTCKKSPSNCKDYKGTIKNGQENIQIFAKTSSNVIVKKSTNLRRTSSVAPEKTCSPKNTGLKRISSMKNSVHHPPVLVKQTTISKNNDTNSANVKDRHSVNGTANITKQDAAKIILDTRRQSSVDPNLKTKLITSMNDAVKETLKNWCTDTHSQASLDQRTNKTDSAKLSGVQIKIELIINESSNNSKQLCQPNDSKIHNGIDQRNALVVTDSIQINCQEILNLEQNEATRVDQQEVLATQNLEHAPLISETTSTNESQKNLTYVDNTVEKTLGQDVDKEHVPIDEEATLSHGPPEQAEKDNSPSSANCREKLELEKQERDTQLTVEQQEVLASQCLHHLPIFYQREIENITKKTQGLCPKVIDEISKNLRQELADLCKSLLTKEEIANRTVDNLNSIIYTEWEQIQSQYLDDLQQKQAQAQCLVKKYKSKYEIDMGSFIKSDQFLENNFTEDYYNDQHLQLKEQVTTHFKQDIASELGGDEPVNKHLETLNHYLEKSKVMFRKKVEVGRPLPKGPNQMTNAAPSESIIPICSAEPTREVECKVAPYVKSLPPANDNPTSPCSVPINTSNPKYAMLATDGSGRAMESYEIVNSSPLPSKIAGSVERELKNNTLMDAHTGKTLPPMRQSVHSIRKVFENDQGLHQSSKVAKIEGQKHAPSGIPL